MLEVDMTYTEEILRTLNDYHRVIEYAGESINTRLDETPVELDGAAQSALVGVNLRAKTYGGMVQNFIEFSLAKPLRSLQEAGRLDGLLEELQLRPQLLGLVKEHVQDTPRGIEPPSHDAKDDPHL